jgi:hypothetical protein
VATVAATAPAGEPAPPPQPDVVRLRAVHLGGIANLGAGEGELELQISRVGFEILRGPEHATLGRLGWHEIVALETPDVGGRFRRRRSPAQLVVRSQQGSARFEIPGVTREELRKQMRPLLERH